MKLNILSYLSIPFFCGKVEQKKPEHKYVPAKQHAHFQDINSQTTTKPQTNAQHRRSGFAYGNLELYAGAKFVGDRNIDEQTHEEIEPIVAKKKAPLVLNGARVSFPESLNELAIDFSGTENNEVAKQIEGPANNELKSILRASRSSIPSIIGSNNSFSTGLSSQKSYENLNDEDFVEGIGRTPSPLNIGDLRRPKIEYYQDIPRSFKDDTRYNTSPITDALNRKKITEIAIS